MGCKAENYAAFLKLVFKLSNIHGALVTMPHKVTVTGMVNDLSTTARIAGACNAVLLRPEGSLAGDMFDGDGFVRGVLRKGRQVAERTSSGETGSGSPARAMTCTASAVGRPGSFTGSCSRPEIRAKSANSRSSVKLRPARM